MKFAMDGLDSGDLSGFDEGTGGLDVGDVGDMGPGELDIGETEPVEIDWGESPTSEANAEMDAALDNAFTPGAGSDAPADLDQALDDAFPAEEPGGLDYEPSPTGVSYPDPERMEGNVGGPERGG